ncbi:MAG: hypothetical protein DMG81_09885 [Acidobacteria bacterium]|nr:MAG: hypothetical protein DMG81_09885 [Acidobacteriota bacterium]
MRIARLVAFLTVFFAMAAVLASAAVCPLNSPSGRVQHVIYVQFDNTHFVRDNPNVPSDLEQMPHLLNFIKGNGTLLSNHHTPLISHTATDILTSLTGVYGDRHGVPVSNSFRYFNPDGTSNTGVSFAYWTDPLFDPTTSTPTDTLPNMLTADGKNAPAPWVPFTRAGCNVGAVATANTILENIATDIPTVFGANSPQAMEVASNPGQAFADFVGIGVHCAAGDALCSSANGGEPDLLPAEPGTYSGFQGLFGHVYVAPQISPNGPLTDLNGNVIQDATGHIGFPGFDGMAATVSLAYVAALQEHGVPVTYAYISDAHDAHPSARSSSRGWQPMASLATTRCSCLPRMKAITSSAARRVPPIATAFTCPAPTRRLARSIPILPACWPPSRELPLPLRSTPMTRPPSTSRAIRRAKLRSPAASSMG